MSRLRLFTLVLIVLFSLEGCIPFMRSAGGLSKGQFQVSYNTPFEEDIRYGVTNNIEYRVGLIGESFETDVMYHSAANDFDYSAAIGLSWRPDWDGEELIINPKNAETQSLGLALMVSKNIGTYFNPYLGYSMSTSMRGDPYAGNFFACGVEVKYVSDKLPLGIAFTPEVVFIPGGTGGDFDISWWGSAGLGIIIDFGRLLN